MMGVPRRNIQGGEDVPLCLLVNHDSAGEIIGKKGSGFKRFREQFGANVKVTNDPAFTGLGRSVEISGEPSSQDAAARVTRIGARAHRMQWPVGRESGLGLRVQRSG